MVGQNHHPTHHLPRRLRRFHRHPSSYLQHKKDLERSQQSHLLLQYRDLGFGAVHARIVSRLGRNGQVIVAGYTGEMRRFLDSNSGLRSRFTRTIGFADYDASELAAIYRGLCTAARLRLAPGTGDALAETCDGLLRSRAETFGNGRAMRTLWERTREAQATRVMSRADRDRPRTW